MKIKVESKEVNLNSFSLPFNLPTLQKAVLKTVWKECWLYKKVLHRRLFFTYMTTIPGAFSKFPATTEIHDRFEYQKTWIKIK